MGIFSSGKSKEKNELALVFHIGSSSMGGVLFYMQDSGVPRIIFSVREPIPLQKTLDVDRFLISTIKSLDDIASRIYKANLGAPKKVFCVLSSPWCISQTRIINYSKNTPFTFTAKLADELIKKETSLFKEQHLANYPNPNDLVRTIELKSIQTALNGYETSSPLDQKAKELEMSIFISMSPENVLAKIEKTIYKNFHVTNVKFSSFAIASFSLVRDLYTAEDNFLLVHIGGEVTEIAMVKKNIMRESISFPLGHNFMLRRVSANLDLSLDEAGSFISLFKDGHATGGAKKKIEPIMDKLKIEWLAEFQSSLANISSDISIPATIYIFINKDFANFFIETIKSEQFNQYTLTQSKFKIILIDTETLHGTAVFEGDSIRDPFIIADTVYINRFLNQK